MRGNVEECVRDLDGPGRHRDHLDHQLQHERGVEQVSPSTPSGHAPAVGSIDDNSLEFIPLLSNPLNNYIEMPSPNNNGENVESRAHAQYVSRKPQTSPSEQPTSTVPARFIPTKEDNVSKGVKDFLLRKMAETDARVENETKKDEDKIGKLYQLVLGREDAQLKREVAREAEKHARYANEEARLVKFQAEKKAASEKAKDLLDATKAAREQAERKAAQEKSELKQFYEDRIAKAENNKAEKNRESAPVMFEDAIGRKFSCPWQSCKTWKEMEEFIQQISAGVRVIDQLVENRQYDLTKDDLVVPPQLWETMIQPGSSVVMRPRDSVAAKSTPWYRKSFKKSEI